MKEQYKQGLETFFLSDQDVLGINRKVATLECQCSVLFDHMPETFWEPLETKVFQYESNES